VKVWVWAPGKFFLRLVWQFLQEEVKRSILNPLNACGGNFYKKKLKKHLKPF
jgi:hypothetical protein